MFGIFFEGKWSFCRNSNHMNSSGIDSFRDTNWCIFNEYCSVPSLVINMKNKQYLSEKILTAASKLLTTIVRFDLSARRLNSVGHLGIWTFKVSNGGNFELIRSLIPTCGGIILFCSIMMDLITEVTPAAWKYQLISSVHDGCLKILNLMQKSPLTEHVIVPDESNRCSGVLKLSENDQPHTPE